MNQSRPRQFFQRVVNLRPGYPRPIPNLPPLQLEIGLITMHWPLREQAQEHQVRRRQRKSQGRAPDSSLSLCASQRSPCLCVILSLHLFPSCALCSTTTLGIAPPAAAGCAPAPPPRETYPVRKDLAAGRSGDSGARTFFADSAARVAPHCESPATQNPAASPAQSKSNLPIAAPFHP